MLPALGRRAVVVRPAAAGRLTLPKITAAAAARQACCSSVASCPGARDGHARRERWPGGRVGPLTAHLHFYYFYQPPPLVATSRPYLSQAGGRAPPNSGSPVAAGAQGRQAASASPTFRIHRISGDGACMFRAVVQGAQYLTHGSPMPQQAEAAAALNLRQAVVRELRTRREEIEPFLPGIAPDFDEYLRNMSNPMVWGGEPEMVMAVHVVRRPLTVYHIQAGGLEPIVTYGDQLLAAGVAPIHLLWSGAHYDLLVPDSGGGAAAAA